MKFLYYSTAYHSNHGGSIQSIEFYRTLKRFEEIKEYNIFPKELKKPVGSQAGFSIRNFLKTFPLLQVIFFYRKNKMYLSKLEKSIKEKNPDVLLLQIDSNFLQIKKIKKKFPKLIVCTQVNASPFDEPFKNIAFKNSFMKKQADEYAFSDLNFFISNFLRQRIMLGSVNTERDKVVHNGTDIKKFMPINGKKTLRESLGYSTDDLIIGYIGTLDFHKKLDILIKAICELKLKYSNLKLIIIGSGPAFSSIKNEIYNLELQETIILKGWIDHNDINKHLNCFDIGIHHHANDYMSPLKIFEYLSAGLPVVGPDIPAVREIFKNGVEIKLTTGTKDDIIRNLDLLLKNEKERKRIGELGAKVIREKYTWHKYVRSILNDIIFLKKKNNERSFIPFKV